MTHPHSGVPISYCTNVHPAQSVPDLLETFDRYAVPVRDALEADCLDLGLWLPAEVAAGLAADPAARMRLRAELDARRLSVRSLNAFPYRGFHDEVVKHSVYSPNWTERDRVQYTMDCAVVLADLLAPDAAHGSISTLPLGWRQPWDAAEEQAALAGLRAVEGRLRESSARCSRPIRLAVEPEPGCVLDTMSDAVRWLASRVDHEFIGLCLDTCHLAVSFEDPRETLASISASGLRLAKVQVSSAVEVANPKAAHTRSVLTEFAEPRYLHQVRERVGGARVEAADDLPQALRALPGNGPWRVHYHVPLHASPQPPLAATTEVIEQVFAELGPPAAADFPHIEVETYTWHVLPEHYQQDLVSGIRDELRWARQAIAGGVVAR